MALENLVVVSRPAHRGARVEHVVVRPYWAFGAFGAASAALSAFVCLLATGHLGLLPGAFLLVFAIGLGVSSTGMLISARGAE
jgi:hypothetical protein